MPGKQFPIQNPLRVEDIVGVNILEITIFDDGSDLDFRQSEGLGQILHPPPFNNRFVVHLAVEVGDVSVGPNGSRLNFVNVALALYKRDFDVRILAAFLSEDLDPVVAVFARFLVVTIYLAVKENGGSAGSVRLAGHLQFFRGDGLPIVRCGCVRNGDEDCATKQKKYGRGAFGERHLAYLPGVPEVAQFVLAIKTTVVREEDPGRRKLRNCNLCGDSSRAKQRASIFSCFRGNRTAPARQQFSSETICSITVAQRGL